MSIVTAGCSSASLDRSPSFASNSNLKLMIQREYLTVDRDFGSTQSQDIKICGELYVKNSDFLVRSQCKNSGSESFDGVSKIPSENLLPEAQRNVWNGWTESARARNEGAKSNLVPFVCFVGRGDGDPCDRKSGSVIKRVRRFTTDEQQFKSW